MPAHEVRVDQSEDIRLAARIPIGSRRDAAAIRAKRHRIIIPSRLTTLIDGVFEGGGTLGTAYIGSLRALSENGIWFKRVAGNSAGAITAVLIAAGYNAADIQWLTSNFAHRGPRPRTLPSAITAPIDFRSFLNLPQSSADYEASTRRSSLLWNLLKGQIIDSFLELPLPIPTRNQLAREITGSVVSLPLVPDNLQGAIADAVSQRLGFFPNHQPLLRTLIPDALNSQELRAAFADTLWNAIADRSLVYRLAVNLVHEGGLFDGDQFLRTMSALLKAKFPGARREVRMRELPLPLAVITADTHANQMVVLSAATEPNLPAAEAVRRSMSIPFCFQPRPIRDPQGGRPHEIMDGGLCSNYPFWLFSPAGEGLMPPSDPASDDRRLKLGFILDDDRAAPAAWNAEPPTFTDGQGHAAKAGPLDALARVAGLDVRQSEGGESEVESIDRIFRVLDTMDRKEQFLRERTSKLLMDGRPYHEVHIPVRGFHWLDFSVNSDEDIFASMADRGWQATVDTLLLAGLIPVGSNQVSPFRPSP